jgi:formate hydrogenlyase subunit 6/NADH:ubiquinone oxidoreductase subunit I
MMGFDWQKIPLISQSLQEEGILPSRIEVPGEWKGFQFDNVKLGIVSFSSNMMNKIPSFAKKFLRTKLEFYPDFNEDCRLCQVCVKSCPVQAITYTKGDKHPIINYAKCIKCLCCHELCPYHAVYIHKSRLAKMFIH